MCRDIVLILFIVSLASHKYTLKYNIKGLSLKVISYVTGVT